jgi:hypothetical protein
MPRILSTQAAVDQLHKMPYQMGLNLMPCNAQAPPNLTPAEEGADRSQGLQHGWAALLDAGINDWGGLSPLTRDYVNPEKPWPHISGLAAVTASAGFPLLPRC